MSNTIQNQTMHRIKIIFLWLLGIYIMIGTTLYFIQEKILFRPTVLEHDYEYQFSQPFEEVFLTMNDGAVINAIHFKTDAPKGVILYFHGNAGDLSRWGLIAESFVELQYDVFIMDYRTYGKSTGKLSEKALYEDAQSCYEYLLKHYDESEITIFGRSLGTGIATHVASQNNPKQLILETPYYSMIDVAQHKFPFLPIKHLLKYKFLTFEYIQNVKCPITIFHGTEDSVVPFESGKKLFDLIEEKNKNFIKVEGGNHNNLIEFEAYRNAIKSLLK